MGKETTCGVTLVDQSRFARVLAKRQKSERGHAGRSRRTMKTRKWMMVDACEAWDGLVYWGWDDWCDVCEGEESRNCEWILEENVQRGCWVEQEVGGETVLGVAVDECVHEVQEEETQKTHYEGEILDWEQMIEPVSEDENEDEFEMVWRLGVEYCEAQTDDSGWEVLDFPFD